jgi:hypothetical protein
MRARGRRGGGSDRDRSSSGNRSGRRDLGDTKGETIGDELRVGGRDDRGDDVARDVIVWDERLGSIEGFDGAFGSKV